MKLSTCIVAVAVGLAAGRVLPNTPDLNTSIAPAPRIKFDRLPPPIDDTQWEYYACKGSKLVEAMLGSDTHAGQFIEPGLRSAKSNFTDFPAEFDKWYYHDFNPTRKSPDFLEFDDYWGIGDALRDLGVSDCPTPQDCPSGRPSKNEVFSRVHWDRDAYANGLPIPLPEQRYYVKDTFNGVPRTTEYPATGAEYTISFNRDEGVIIAMSRQGPKFMSDFYELNVPDNRLPMLKQASDILYGMWDMFCRDWPSKKTNIRYMFNLNVSNKVTLPIISRALGSGGLKEFPGVRFPMNSKEGQALLGSPNGVGAAFFFIQHKEQLGIKVIHAAHLFACAPAKMPKDHPSDPDEYDTAKPCLLFEVAEKEGLPDNDGW